MSLGQLLISTMSFATVLLILGHIWFLGVLLILLHRWSWRIGLAPLQGAFIALVILISVPTLGSEPEIYSTTLSVVFRAMHSAILFGLLMIYIANGTRFTQTTLLSLFVTVLIVALLQITFPLQASLISKEPLWNVASTRLIPSLLSSGLALLAGTAGLAVVYQGWSNWRKRHPSLFGGVFALIFAVLVDALVVTTITHYGSASWSSAFVTDFAAKAVSALALVPLVLLFISHLATSEMKITGTTPRSAFDVFAPQRLAISPDQHHYNLLRTLRQIDQHIQHTTDLEALLCEACNLLVDGSNFPLVWIDILANTTNGDDFHSRPYTCRDSQHLVNAIRPHTIPPPGPAGLAAFCGDAVIINNIHFYQENNAWKEAAVNAGFHSAAFLPMRNGSRVLGVVCLFSIGVFSNAASDEVSLLQQLADDLAYAITNIERQRRQSVLNTSAQSMRDGLVITDMNWNVIYSNKAIQSLAHSINGGPILEENILPFLPGELRGRIDKEILPVLLLESQVTVETKVDIPQGTPLYLSARISLVRDENTEPQAVVINVRDITRQKKFEHQLLTLNRLTADLVQIHQPDELLHTILEASRELLRADSTAIHLLGSANGVAREILTYNLPSEYSDRNQGYQPALLRTWENAARETICIEDVSVSNPWQELAAFLQKIGLRAVLSLPIHYQNAPLGALVFYYTSPRSFSEEDLQLGSTAAHALAIALQNAYLYQAENDQRQFAEGLAEASIALNSSLELEKVLDKILERALRVNSCQSVNIMLIEGDLVRVVRHHDWSDPEENIHRISGTTLPLHLPTFLHMKETGKPILIADTSSDPAWAEFSQTQWIRSYAAAPLRVNGKVIGFLNTNSDQSNTFDEESIRRLQAFAATAAIAMHNARLYNDLEQHSLMLEDRVLERTAELRAAKESIERILGAIPDAVCVLNSEGTVEHANPAGEVLLSLAAEHGVDLFSAEHIVHLNDTSRPSGMNLLEVRQRAYQALASPLPGKNGHAKTVVVFRDVTRFREIDQLKSQFVSDVSHELRTPLTNIIIYLELLSTVSDPSMMQNYISTIHKETEHLTHLIDDFLTISRLKDGKVHVDLQKADVNQFIADIVEEQVASARQRNLHLEYRTRSDLPPAQTDPRLLSQVVSNLLDNALNYTPEHGFISITTSLEENEGKLWVAISVSDTGVGIAPNEIEHIFKRFYRGRSRQISGASGTGLGLAIARELTEHMGGMITVESELNRGSTFTVWLEPVL